MNEPMHVATTANDSYFPGLCVTIISILMAKLSPAEVIFHVFDTGISDSNKQRLKHLTQTYGAPDTLIFHTISADRFTGLERDYGGGYSAYSRLLIGSLIDAPRLIYTDCDFLFLKDISSAWSIDMRGQIMLAVRDIDTVDGKPGILANDCPFISPDDPLSSKPYFNSGFSVVDLDLWRSAKIEERSLFIAKGYEKKLRAWDQTLLNYVLIDRIGELDPTWSRSNSWRPVEDNCNIHYISQRKPWNSWSNMPAHRLWHAFRRVFLDNIPLNLPLKTVVIGRLMAIRDAVIGRHLFLRRMYFSWMRGRKTGKSTIALFDRSLAMRQAYYAKGGAEDTKRRIRELLQKWKGKQR